MTLSRRTPLASLLAALFSLCVTGSLGCHSRPAEPGRRIRVVPQVGVVQPRRLQFSPHDGNRLLVMEATGLVGVWDVTTPTQPQLFASMRASATDARFSPDGTGIVTVGIDGHVRWWNVDGTLRWTSPDHHDGWTRTVAVTSTRIFTGGEDGTIRFWTLDGAADGAPLHAHDGAVLTVDTAPNGDLVSMGTDEVVRLWRPNAGGADPAYTAQVLYREVSPRHSRLLPSLLRLDVQWGWDRAAVFSPKGDTIAATVFDGALRLWDGDGKERAVILKAHKGHHIRSMAFAPDGTALASVGFDGGVQLWNLDGSPQGPHIEAHRGPALGIAVSPDGTRVVSAGVDDRLHFWKRDGTGLGDFPRAYTDRIRAFAFAPKSHVFACGEAGGSVSVWNLDGFAHGKPLAGHRGPADAVAFSAQENLIVSGGKDATVRLWHTDGTPVGNPFTGHIDGVISATFSPDARFIATGSRNDALRVWNTAGKQLLALNGLRDMITDIAYSPDGKLFAASDAPGEFMVWNADGTVHTNVVKAHHGYLAQLAFSPDGQSIATVGADNLVKLWSVDGEALGDPLSGHLAAIKCLAFEPSGKALASGSADGTVLVWNLATRTARTLFVGIAVDQVGFAGELLWVRANGETLLLYNEDLELKATLQLRRDAVLVTTPDGWFSGPPDAARFARFYDAEGRALSDADGGQRFAPDRVRAAVTLR